MLFPILSLMMGSGIQRGVARAKRNAIFLAIAGLFLLTAYVLGVAAGTLWLAELYGPVAASFFVAICALVIAVVILIIMSVINSRDARQARSRADVQSAAALGLNFVRGQPLLTAGVLAAFVAANLIGNRDDD